MSDTGAKGWDRRRAYGDATEGEPLFDDLDVEEATREEALGTDAVREKSPLVLVLMLAAPHCPIFPGTPLHIHVTPRGDTVRGRERGLITVLEHGLLETRDGVRGSLSTAAHVYTPERRTAPEGWQMVKYANPARANTFLPMNVVLRQAWGGAPLLSGVEVPDLELANEATLRAKLIAAGFGAAVEAHDRHAATRRGGAADRGVATVSSKRSKSGGGKRREEGGGK